METPRKNRILMISLLQMVRSQHGHRHRLDPPPQPALQRLMAAVHFLRHLWPQRRPFHHFLRHEHPPLRALPKDLERHARAPGAVPLPGLLPHGLCQ